MAKRNAICNEVYPLDYLNASYRTDPAPMALLGKSPLCSSRFAPQAKRGMTLVEVMIGFALLGIVMAGIFALLLQSYRLSMRTRYIDESRNILRSLGDDFMPPSGMASSSGGPNPLMVTTPGPTGNGLIWITQTGNAASLDVPIGKDAGTPVIAHITRDVRDLDETSGAVDASSSANSAAGRLIQCQLTLTFTAANQPPWTETITLVRSTMP